jgi:hypothetical protein
VQLEADLKKRLKNELLQPNLAEYAYGILHLEELP